MRNILVSVLVLAMSAVTLAAPATSPSDDANQQKGLLSVDGGIDFTTAYFFRGYREESHGLVAQPYGTISLNVPSLQSFGGTDLSITPYAGTWNSIHSDTTGYTKSPSNWYETDLIAGVNIAKGPFTFGLLYTDYTSPSGNFADTQEIGATLAYSDPGLFGITLNPKVGIYRELNHSANFKRSTPGTYLEAGIEPSRDFTIGTQKVTLSIPTTFGVGFSGYYRNADGSNTELGFISSGLRASMPLWGQWSLTATALYLHDFAPSAYASNGDNPDQIIGTIGLGFSF